ncbi:3-isopropylmalate dehydratase small subunit [Sphingomonas sp. SM33]|uniref:3-isopropylmalate dehydratase n=1 Tax=Sphingomonas telluris TaxID=2907998 RepID=A0ABS9VMZ9_9SPHN|nr:3-isopropylmalate dehydratase small subunit [Sphingomonas telluris]MCH8616083.1 3-isopropylmalate dehydratase small subunit [Sphingomonas telluris]
MTPFTRVEGRAYVLPLSNVDTDLIIPAEHLKTIRRSGLGSHAFEALRSVPGNTFDDPVNADAPIIVALDNFGCGSSREHAAWALADLGVRAVIAPSFSDIFAGNAFKNGIAAVELDHSAVETLLHAARKHSIAVDLEAMTVTSSAGDHFTFSMDRFRRECLLAGLDEIALTLTHEPAIRAYEQRVGI